MILITLVIKKVNVICYTYDFRWCIHIFQVPSGVRAERKTHNWIFHVALFLAKFHINLNSRAETSFQSSFVVFSATPPNDVFNTCIAFFAHGIFTRERDFAHRSVYDTISHAVPKTICIRFPIWKIFSRISFQ